ncbi:hypothetical protein [Alkalitalea saponilacus]|uniref:Uncharacterized protein n=1 Tax=Alkalitalea saponilacus TaxID=889453 RepID=A0A1T5HTQ0_9BACT|nr:hypothetical protein [Alkalitalea saponilacus]ASB49306.1 hypothetical protein CDL62_09205 [Alkalitalea saponilacus]SKC24056.1 hypothetical protein SAMN03080601_03348 [Alkalitalea saponilacus]
MQISLFHIGHRKGEVVDKIIYLAKDRSNQTLNLHTDLPHHKRHRRWRMLIEVIDNMKSGAP